MSFINTKEQKDNLAKFAYDIAKIIFAIIVIGPFVKYESFSLYVFIIGLLWAIIFLLIGNLLDGKEV